MRRLGADGRDGLSECVVCDKHIVDGNWFARIYRREGTIVLCCPRCTVLFVDDAAGYLRRREVTGDADGRNV